MARIKLLYISQATGGVKRHITLLAEHLDKNQFDIAGYFPPREHIRGAHPDKESFSEAFGRLGLRVLPLEMCREIRPFRDLVSFLKLVRLLKKERWDIVHTHSSKAGFLGRIAARLAGVPVVIHTPNAFAFDRPPHSALNFLYVFLERIAGRFCDALIAVSPSEEALAREAKVISPEKIVQICNGIDAEEIDIRVDVRMKKKSLGLPEGRPVVLTIGRLAPQKSPGVFLDAAKRVLRRTKEVSFVMVGDGPLFRRVKDQIAKEGLSSHLFLLDWREDAKEIMAICDVYVLSSLWEGLPYTVLEAMALRKPVVATAARGTRDLVQDGTTGFLVGLYDAEKMAEKILALLTDKALSRGMGEAGRLRGEKEFTLVSHLQKTSALYLRLLSEKEPDDTAFPGRPAQ